MATIRRPSTGSIREVRLLGAAPAGRAVRWRGRVYEVAAREESAGCVHLVPAATAQALSSTTREPTGSLPRVMSP